MKEKLARGAASLWERRGSIVGWLFAFSPALVLGILIDKHAVNVPVWDDWEMVPYIAKAKAGELTFGDLYAPHIEHRMVFPRLILIGLAMFGDGDLRWAIGFIFVLGLVAGLGVWRLARDTVFEKREESAGLYLCLFLANLIIFSPIQWQNWLWAIQVAFMLPMACMVWAIWVVSRRHLFWWKRLIWASVLAIIGTHSFSHGLFIWPAVLGLALLLPAFGKTPARRWFFVGGWIAIASIVIGCYFGLEFKNVSDATHAYFQEPGADPPMMRSIEMAKEKPEKTADFFLTMIGNPLSRGLGTDPLVVAPVIGIVILGLFLSLSIAFIVLVKRFELWARALPWLALGGAVLCTEVGVTIARVGFGSLSRALVTRYISISLYLVVALVFLTALLWRNINWNWWQDRRAAAGAFLIAVLVGVQLCPWIYGARMMKLWEHSRYAEQAQLTFLEKLTPANPWKIDATVGFPLRHIRTLDKFGYLEINLIESLDLYQFNVHEKAMAASRGQVEVFEEGEDGTFTINGFSQINREDPRAADVVLLTWEPVGRKKDAMIFSLADDTEDVTPLQYHFDLEFTGRRSREVKDHYRWSKTFSRDEIDAEGPVVIKAWAFSVDTRRPYRIAGEWTIE